jgi:hypothetical protein
VVLPVAAEEGSRPASAASIVDWGVNIAGWDITLDNDSGTTLRLIPPLWTDNVDLAPDTIAADAQTTQLRGKVSWFGGPANVNVAYASDGGATFHLTISSDFKGDVNALCSREGAALIYCNVPPVVANQPVVWQIAKAYDSDE